MSGVQHRPNVYVGLFVAAATWVPVVWFFDAIAEATPWRLAAGVLWGAFVVCLLGSVVGAVWIWRRAPRSRWWWVVFVLWSLTWWFQDGTYGDIDDATVPAVIMGTLALVAVWLILVGWRRRLPNVSYYGLLLAAGFWAGVRFVPYGAQWWWWHTAVVVLMFLVSVWAVISADRRVPA